MAFFCLGHCVQRSLMYGIFHALIFVEMMLALYPYMDGVLGCPFFGILSSFLKYLSRGHFLQKKRTCDIGELRNSLVLLNILVRLCGCYCFLHLSLEISLPILNDGCSLVNLVSGSFYHVFF